MASEYSNRGAKRAREARADLGYAQDGPLPALLEAVEDQAGVHVLVLELPAGVAGAYVVRPGRSLLFVNGEQALSRQRFTLAHEFGHHRMGHASVVDAQTTIGGQTRDPNEVGANAFAAEFLMPRAAIARWASDHSKGNPTLEDVLMLAGEYGVSAQAARYALATAEVLTSAKRCRQIDDEIAEGMHVAVAEQMGLQLREDRLADAAARLPRLPPALRDTALGDLLAGEIDARGLAERLGRDNGEVQAMLVELGFDRLLPAAL